MKSKAYYLNEEQTLACFYPTKASWKKKLTVTDFFYASFFVSEGLCFRGKISLEKFLSAMHNTLQDFDFLFSQLYKSEEGLYASYSTEDENKHFISLEIEKIEESINTSTLASILPNKIDERIRGVVTDKFEGLPMGTFKLTTFKDGFTIGYYLNHAFFDQSSMVYFFKYLSHLYSYGKDNMALKLPNLVDTDSLFLSENPPRVFKSLADFREHGEAHMGLEYIPPGTDNTDSSKTDDAELSPKPESYLTVDLNFNVSEINKLKNTAKHYLSVNDIIHATLLKIYSFNPDLPLDKVFNFGFACNMRKYCGLGKEAIGNILSRPFLLLKVEDIENKTLLELALVNRQRVSGITLEYYKESLVWYRYLQEHHENPLHYAPTFNLLKAMVSNWSTFDYDSILFDGAAPIELKAPNFASFRANIISFAKKDSQIILKSSISVPFDGLKPLRELEYATKLFSSRVSEAQVQIEAKENAAAKDIVVTQSKFISAQAAPSFFQIPHAEQPIDMTSSDVSRVVSENRKC